MSTNDFVNVPIKQEDIPVAQIATQAELVAQQQQQQNEEVKGAVFYKNDHDPRVLQLASDNYVDGGIGVLFIRIGSLNYRGKFVVPKKLSFIVIFSGAKIDLSNAVFVHPRTEISVLCIFGGVKVILPPGVRGISNGIGIFGGIGRHQEDGDTPFSLDAPTVRVTGLAIFGGAKQVTNQAVDSLKIMN